MERKVITLEINFTGRTLVVLVGALLLAAGLVVAGVVLAQTPDHTEEEMPVGPAAYDETLYPRLPRQMNYQGVLTDGDGNPIDGTHDLTLTIYEWRRQGLSASWNEVYSETQTVAVNDGLFNVLIGDVNSLDPDDFGGLYSILLSKGGELELGVKVDGGPELTPRAKLLPVPYAFRAEHVNRFPAPHYDSGWVDVPTGVSEFTHNLGGEPDNYVVDMMCKSFLPPDGSPGVNNWFLGGELYYHSYTQDLIQYGAQWQNLDSGSIELYRYADDIGCGQVRIRIWRIE